MVVSGTIATRIFSSIYLPKQSILASPDRDRKGDSSRGWLIWLSHLDSGIAGTLYICFPFGWNLRGKGSHQSIKSLRCDPCHCCARLVFVSTAHKLARLLTKVQVVRTH